MHPIDIDALVRREAWDELAAYLEANWIELTHSHRSLLVRAFNSMPPRVLASNARLAAAHEYANFIPARGVARPTKYHHVTGDQRGLLDILAHLTSQSAGARMLGRFEDAVAAVKRALRVLRETPAAQTQAIAAVLPDLRLQWAISLQLAGRVPAAIQEYERTYNEAIRHNNIRVAVEAAGTISFDFAYLGMPTQARQWLNRVPLYEHDGSDPVDEMGELAAALLSAHELDLSNAVRLIGTPRAVSSETWAMRFFVESFVASLAGSANGFAAKLLALRAEHPAAVASNGLNGVLLSLASADAAMHITDVSQAAAATSASITSLPNEAPRGLVGLLTGWNAAQRGDTLAAAALASQPLAEGTATPGVAAELRALLAIVYLELKQESEAGAHFRTCLEIVTTERLFDVLHRFTPDELGHLEVLTGQSIPEEARRALGAVSAAVRRSRPARVKLTPRERVVLRHLLLGHSRTEIAREENLSPNTIKAQIASVYRKLGVTDRDGAVRAVAESPHLLR